VQIKSMIPTTTMSKPIHENRRAVNVGPPDRDGESIGRCVPIGRSSDPTSSVSRGSASDALRLLSTRTDCPIGSGYGERGSAVMASAGHERRREHLAHERLVASEVRTPQTSDHLVVVALRSCNVGGHGFVLPQPLTHSVSWPSDFHI